MKNPVEVIIIKLRDDNITYSNHTGFSQHIESILGFRGCSEANQAQHRNRKVRDVVKNQRDKVSLQQVNLFDN